MRGGFRQFVFQKSVFLKHPSAYLQNYTFRDKSTHVHNGSTLIYPISQEMHVKEDAGEYFHISSFHTLLSPVIYHITIMGDFFIKYRPF